MIWFGQSLSSTAQIFHLRTPRSPSALNRISYPSSTSLTDLSIVSRTLLLQRPPKYPSVVVEDYLGILEKLVVEDNALSFINWTFRPGDKKRWNSDRCRIAVGASALAEHTISTVFQPVLSAHLAGKLAQECFKPGRMLGGQVTFGSGCSLGRDKVKCCRHSDLLVPTCSCLYRGRILYRLTHAFQLLRG